jgi:hypothetical protein
VSNASVTHVPCALLRSKDGMDTLRVYQAGFFFVNIPAARLFNVWMSRKNEVEGFHDGAVIDSSKK